MFFDTWMTSLLASSHFCLISSFLVPTNSFISSTLPWSLKNSRHETNVISETTVPPP